MTVKEKDHMINTLWQSAEKNLNELITNVRPAEHLQTPLSTLIETVKFDLLALRNAGFLNPDTHE